MSSLQINIDYSMIFDLCGDHTLVGSTENVVFNNVKALERADASSLVFIAKGRVDKLDVLESTKAKVVIIDCSDLHVSKPGKTLILVDDPKLVFSKIANKYFDETIEYLIHPSAVIHPQAIIHERVKIGPNCVIGRGEIGEGTIIHGNVYIFDDFVIGKNVTINPGSVIGAEGFGFNRDDSARGVQFPHFGRTIIEDDVHIGSNTSIDRGALSDTIIRRGAKIDNLVHISHNVIVGENTFVIAHAMIGGSTIVGSGVYIAPCVAVRDQLKIGDNAFVGMSAAVNMDIPPEEIWTGVPAQPLERIKEFNKKLRTLLKR